MKMTERDKKLLILLAVVVLLVGFGRLVFYPLFTQITERDEQIDNLEIQQQEMEMKIAQKPALEMSMDAVTADFQEKTSDFYDLLQNQEVDREITQIILAHGLDAVEFSVTMPKEPLAVEYYQYSAAASGAEGSAEVPEATDTQMSPEEQAMAQAGDTAAAGTPAPAEARGTFFAPTVKLTVLGNQAQVQNFLDDLTNHYPAIRVTGYTMKEQEENGVGIGVFSLSVDLEVYTCDKSAR